MNSDVLCNSRFWSVSIEQWTKAARWKNTCSLGTITRVAEVAREHGWHPPKSLDSDENFKPEHTLFCRELRFVAIYALFGDLWAKKCLFGSKTVFLGQEVHYYMVYIAYFTELILQICDYAQKRRIWRENCKYVLDKNFHCHFCSRRKAAKFCHPALVPCEVPYNTDHLTLY